MDILDINPLTGEMLSFRYNHDNDTVTLGHHQDTEALLERNKEAMLDPDKHRRQAKEEWAHYATIPNIVVLEWRQKYGVDFFDKNHWSACMKLLNDPEYRYLKRTTYFHDR